MEFVVRAVIGGNQTAWIKRQAGPYRIGPRGHATVFVTRGEAREAIRQLPEVIRNAAKFTVEAAE